MNTENEHDTTSAADWARAGLAATAVGAGAIHLAMVPSHAAEWWLYGAWFAIAGWAQLGLGVAVAVRASRRWLLGLATLSAVAIGAWAWTRVAGWPFGPGAGDVEPVGWVDAACVALETVSLVVAALVWWRPVAVRSTRASALVGAAVALLVAGSTSVVLASPDAQHEHDGGHEHVAATADATLDHDDSASAAEAGGHDHTTTAATSAAGSGHVHAECTAPVTADQQSAADALVADTRAGDAAYADISAATAAGYKPITPTSQRLVHYANPANMADGAVLDSQRPESLVYLTTRGGRSVLLGAMYMMDDPAATPPQPGGCLTAWHQHANLCIAPGEGMVGTVAADGSCPPGSSNETTTQMLHVWSIDLPTGPFSELDQLDAKTVAAAVAAGLQDGTLQG